MSDQELVTLNSTQFNRLDLLLQAGANALWAINEQLKTGNSNAEILTAINNLNRKVDEFMSTQEERLRGVKTKLDAIQTGVDKIQSQLADLKANNPELEDEISAIEATAGAIDTDVNPVVPDAGTGTGGGEPAPGGGVVTGERGR